MTGWWRGTRLVIGRELLVGFRRKSYRITLAVLLLGGVAVAVVPRMLASDETPEYELGVVGEAPAGFEAALAAAAVASSTTQRLEAAGVPSEQAPTVLAAPPRTETVDTAKTTGRAGVGFAVVLLLYLAILTAGGQVATGVALEKANRFAESLLATLWASQLLAGKVVRIGVLSLVALLAVAVPAAVATATAGDLDIPSGAAGQIVAGVGWFVLCYALYACIYAGLGALVDRQEEVTGAVMPVTMGLIVTYSSPSMPRPPPTPPWPSAVPCSRSPPRW